MGGYKEKGFMVSYLTLFHIIILINMIIIVVLIIYFHSLLVL